MEINAAGRLRRAEQSVRTDGTKKDASVEESSSPSARPQTDSLALTRQAIAQMEEQGQRLTELLEQTSQTPPEQKKPAIWDIVDGGEESGDSEADALGEQLKVMERCHKIAARIMRGDKVPPQDEQYLMMNDPDGYKLALAMRKPKKKPKEWDSVLKDEEKTAESGSEDGGDDAVSSCEASGEASDAGGDSAAGDGTAGE